MEIPVQWQESLEKLLRWRRMLASGALVLLAVAFCAHVLFGANGLISYRHKRTEYLELQQQLQRTEQDNHRLSDEIHGLKSDPKSIERVAREQLRYARPGEVIYLLPNEPGAGASGASAPK